MPHPIKPEISPDLIEQLDVRVGTVLSVDDVPGAERLVALTVDFGDHHRTIIAGLKKERENPKEIQGRQALFVVNLKPRMLRGIRSEGMLFDIGYADGLTPVLAVPEAPMPNGTRAG
jgi:tRNA-binding protein